MRHPLDGYLSPEAREAELRRLAARAGAEVIGYGTTVQGRALEVVRVPAHRPGAPKVLCAANIHGLELIGTSVALGLLEALAAGAHRELRERAEVWIAPSLNPDGHARTFAQGGAGRLAELRPNARGVDLNRNFPRPGGAPPTRWPFGGTDRPGRATYRGPAPLSEPESRAADALLGRERFHALLSLHSTMGTLIPARVLDRPALRAYRRLCRAFREGQRAFRYLRLQSRLLDAFTGELEDHAHHHHRCWATCAEVFPLAHAPGRHLWAGSLFWRFNPRRPRDYVANDVPGVVAYLVAAVSLPRPGQEAAR